MTTDEAIEQIARILFAYEPGTRSTHQVTSDLTQEIVGWALAQGWTARTEARIDVPGNGLERLGFVDILIPRCDGQPGLAIEIDSADKPWSVQKLRHVAAAGMRPVWVRWGDSDWAVAHADIDVIQLSQPRRAARSNRDAQLALWP